MKKDTQTLKKNSNETFGFARWGALRDGVVGLQVGLGIILVTLLVFSSATALGRKKTVTVTGFRGPGAGSVRYYVTKYLRREYEVVPIAKYVRTAKRLRVKVTGRRNIRRICQEAEIDAVVFGRILRSRGRWWLRLSINDGATGKRIKRSVIRLRGPRLNSSSRYSVRGTLKKAMEQATGVTKREPEPEPEPEPKIDYMPTVDTETEGEEKEKKKKKKPMGPRPSWTSVVEGGVMLDVVGRKFVVNPTSSNPDYRTTGLIPSPGFWFEIYPGAFITNHRILANFGLGFSWSRSFGVTSSTDDGENSEDIKTTYQKTDMYLTFRYNILQSDKSPELKLSFGLGNQRFMFNIAGDEYDPIKALGVNYWYAKPKISARVPLALARLSFVFGFAALFPFQKGPVEEWWGYGDTSAWGIDIQGGLDIRVYWRVHALLLGQYTHYSLSFSQQGELGWDYSIEGSGAVDRYYGVILGVGVKYF